MSISNLINLLIATASCTAGIFIIQLLIKLIMLISNYLSGTTPKVAQEETSGLFGRYCNSYNWTFAEFIPTAIAFSIIVGFVVAGFIPALIILIENIESAVGLLHPIIETLLVVVPLIILATIIAVVSKLSTSKLRSRSEQNMLETLDGIASRIKWLKSYKEIKKYSLLSRIEKDEAILRKAIKAPYFNASRKENILMPRIVAFNDVVSGLVEVCKKNELSIASHDLEVELRETERAFDESVTILKEKFGPEKFLKILEQNNNNQEKQSAEFND